MKIQILREVSIEQISKDSLHPKNPDEATAGFRVISQNDEVVQVEAWGRYFYISADALGAYWTGQWILLWWSFPLWTRTLWNRIRGEYRTGSAPFYLTKSEGSLWIFAGSSCGHEPEIAEMELRFNLIGRLLLMEHGLRSHKQVQRGCRSIATAREL
jgi:hypothetical protein